MPHLFTQLVCTLHLVYTGGYSVLEDVGAYTLLYPMPAAVTLRGGGGG